MNNKKVVFIAHPVTGDIEGNIKKVLDICKKIHNREVIPCVPYLACLKYLDNDEVEGRELGVEANLECFHRNYIDELWLFGDRVSKGMKREIYLALKLGIPIVPKTEGTKDYLDEVKES